MLNRLGQTASGALGLWALGLLLHVSPPAPETGVQASTTRAQSFGISVTTLDVSRTSPLAVLSPDAPTVSDQASSVSVPGLAAAENLFAVATGSGGSAESHSTLGSVNLLNGVITADALVAVASSAMDGTAASSNTEGSQLANLVVNGVAVTAEPAPNTRVEIPGVGYVVFNEQIPSGDGLSSTGITVNLIHVYLPTGEIIAGSATSFVSR